MIDLKQALAFSKEDLNSLCDYGLYNSIIAGYLIDAMLSAGLQRNSIAKARSGLNGAVDVISAHEAEGIYRKF